MRPLVIVPTYNERENIARLIRAVLAQDPGLEVLVVDDGSPDGTAAIVAEIMSANPRVHLHQRPRKMGLGTAYIAGFRWALERDYQYVFEMDADFSHDPGHLPNFLEAARNADLVLGSRYRDGKVTIINWPITRLLLSYFANVYARFGHRASNRICHPLHERLELAAVRLDPPAVAGQRLDAAAVRLGILTRPRLEVCDPAADDDTRGGLAGGMLAASDDLDDQVKTGFLMLDGQPQE